jgi:hypothetical protein
MIVLLSEQSEHNLVDKASEDLLPQSNSIKQDLIDMQYTKQPLQTSNEKSCACGAMTSVASIPSHVYAVGRVDFRFPNQHIEKELAQVIGQGDTKELTDTYTL